MNEKVTRDTQNEKKYESQNTYDDNKKQTTPPTQRQISPFIQRKKATDPCSNGIKVGHSSGTHIKKTQVRKRFDRNGIEITSWNKKKVKLTFIDGISTQPLVEIIDVDNFKAYNKVAMPSLEDLYVRNNTTACCSCVLF